MHEPLHRRPGSSLRLLVITSMALSAGHGCASVDNASEKTARVSPPIVGGQPAEVSDYPSTVAITTPAGDPFCSGTLVGPNTVVTAAHCLEGRSIDDTRVVYGYDVPMHAPPEERRVPSFVQAHPLYDPGALQDAYGLGRTNDIGAIVLETPIQGGVVAPILPLSALDAELTPSRPMHIVGYGVYNNSTQASGKLYRGITPHVRHTETELLAGRPGEPDTCYGDSGGPAYVVTDNTLWLIGATSRAWANAVQPCGESTIYTSIPAYADWLASLPGADVDGGVVDGGFEGGGWPPAQDASGGSLLDVAPACVPPNAVCNPLTNEGCDTAAGQACSLDEAKSRVRCEDGPNLVGPGGMCDQTSRLCKAGYHCGPSIKCEKLCCSDADCPPGTPCTPLLTLLGDIGTCGVVFEDASADAVEEPEVGDEPVHDAGTDESDTGGDAGDAAQDTAGDAAQDTAEDAPDGDGSAAFQPGDYPSDPVDPGCGCHAAGAGHASWAGLLAAAAVLAGQRRRRRDASA